MDSDSRDRLNHNLQRFAEILTSDEIERIITLQEQPLPTGIRINRLKADPQTAIRDLSERYGWQVKPLSFIENGWAISSAEISPGKTIEHRMGQYYLQDAASMMPVSLFELSTPAPLILDLAASPGGKTTHLIDRTLDKGFILANDASIARIPALRSVLSSWGGINIAITNYPGESFGAWYPETFDLVLLDAPCSMENLRPTPSHPMRETTSDERLRLQQRQVQLLTSGLQALKIGGQLVYATCSLAPEEDEAVVDAVLNRYPTAVDLTDISSFFTGASPGLSGFNGHAYHPDLKNTLRLWPHRSGTSGFFCALLTKTDSIPLTPQNPPIRDFTRTGLVRLDASTQQTLIDLFDEIYGFKLDGVIQIYDLELYNREGQLFLIPQRYLEGFRSLPFEHIGMPLGRWAHQTFEPAHELISRFGQMFSQGIIQIENEFVEHWIAGHDIRNLHTDIPPNGQYLLVKSPAGQNLGLGKLLPKRLRNMLPRQSV